MNNVKQFFISFGITCAVVIFVVGLCTIIKCCTDTYKNSPVKEGINVDSLISVNDSIKLKVESLDSIKNAKVIEIISLDNDSTVKLFYELVSE